MIQIDFVSFVSFYICPTFNKCYEFVGLKIMR